MNTHLVIIEYIVGNETSATVYPLVVLQCKPAIYALLVERSSTHVPHVEVGHSPGVLFPRGCEGSG